MRKTTRMLELFCGPGGLGLGAIATNVIGHKIFPVYGIDNDKDSVSTYNLNVHDCAVCMDINDMNTSSLPEFDALSFGFPCNDFSIIGERKGVDGEYGELYKHGIRVLHDRSPDWFLAENVGGLKSANEGSTIRKIIKDFEELKYDVVAHLYRLEEYGVPQRRHRILIVGIKSSLGKVFVPPARCSKCLPCGEALAGIGDDAYNHEMPTMSKNVVDRLMLTKPGQNAWNADLPKNLRIKTKTKISQIYKKLDPTLPSYTVTGSGGGGTHMYHWEEPRALTNREKARLQTFPDSFKFCGNRTSVRRQIGMAVPPVAAMKVFEAVLKTLLGIEYQGEPSNIYSTIPVLLENRRP